MKVRAVYFAVQDVGKHMKKYRNREKGKYLTYSQVQKTFYLEVPN